jgi:SAM-dependent methyltransferase
VNRATWARADAIGWYAATEGWTDPAERAALLRVAPYARGGPILDVGVGAGRTTSLLRLVSEDYVAVDYVGEMVDLCRRLHPDVDVRLADARDLAEFESGRFALVNFSFMGIDAVGHEDRVKILREFHRVLCPGGHLVYSTHHRNGPWFGRRPWQRASERVDDHWLVRMVRAAFRLPHSVPSFGRGLRNWRRHRQLHEDHRDWAIATSDAHEYGLVIHFTTPAAERAMLAGVGFEAIALLDRFTAEPVESLREARISAFQVIARKAT